MNKLLLDTHTFLWFITDDPRLSSNAITAIENPLYEKHISIISLWEIAIKATIGKLELAKPFNELIPDQLIENGFFLLLAELQHLNKVLELPLIHRDPFDRLIIAQALVENMIVVTIDSSFEAYKINKLW